MPYDSWKLATPPYCEAPECDWCGKDISECDCEADRGEYTREDYEAGRADDLHSEGLDR